MHKPLRMLATASAIILMSSLLLAAAATTIIHGEFSKLEHQQVDSDAARAVNAVNIQSGVLQSKVKDWAIWDDTYAFITDHNLEYIESNLTNGSLQNIEVNYMLYFNNDQRLVHQKGVDVTTGDDLSLQDDLAESLQQDTDIFRAEEAHTCIVDTSGKLLLIAASPVLTSNGNGPRAGTLVMAQFLDPGHMKQVANMNDLDLSYETAASAKLAQDDAAASERLNVNDTIVQVLPNTRIVGRQQVSNVHSGIKVFARVEQPRDIIVDSERALAYFLYASVAIVVLATLLSTITSRQVQQRDRLLQLKNEFFSIASHELRTPLTAIKGNSQMLSQMYGSKNDADFRRMLSDIHGSSERLIRLVTNFLDIARLEEDRIPLDLTHFAVGDATWPIIEELQTLVDPDTVTLCASVSSDLAEVYADIDRTKQIIYNLVGNSIKFTDKGKITVSTKQQANAVIVSIADTGRGMTPGEASSLFRKFRQNQHSDSKKGSGLGLYISKVMVEKMGGRIWIDATAPGKGTTICFTLPVKSTSDTDSTRPAREVDRPLDAPTIHT